MRREVSMATSTKQFAIVAALTTVATFVILLTATRAEQSVLVRKPAVTASDPATGPILPPPRNPNDQIATGQRDTVELPPQSESAPTQEVLPTPPQRPLLPPQTNQRTTAPATKQSFMRPAEPPPPARGKLLGAEQIPKPPHASPSPTPQLPPPPPQ